MGRSYLVIIVLMGVFSAVVSGINPPSSSASKTFEKRLSDDGGSGSGESSDSSSSSGGSSWSNDGSIELLRNSDGHFYADVQINGATVHALVDTGASSIALSRDDARSAGVGTSIGMPEVVGEGANGAVRGEYVTLDSVSLGNKRVERIDAIVLDSGNMTLLGQSFLSRFAKVEIEGDRMVLR
ncbi:TIGR02281 family clan AA aspartic protease [Sphingomonas sinipercae]|uniref:TIGR02281 family clan AA aspartic protease n=1 Tax=Sphingomonas sinipercae TaxID=2714944 RepID=A0A6G7ZQM6_9SPHN|nr:TIGR02281 family clan AA aspartic protease [Sphingomonas sinipercae]QIL03206.1 TIGR02281 family clan AA aspartic protease [Sphingomonas sinipercae]